MTTSVSLIIPSYNEAERLPLTLRCIQRYRQQNAGPSECIVVDDGSEDSTADVVIGFSSAHPWCCLHRLDAHTGKGAAVRAGMLQAKCDLVFFSDANLSASLANLTTALRLLSGDIDVVFGSRTHPDAKIVRRQSVSRRFAARLGNCLIRGLLDLPYRDTQCGFKGFKREAAISLFEQMAVVGFMFDVEVLLKAWRADMKIAEFPVEWADQPGGRFNLGSNLIDFFSELIQIRRAVHNA